MFGYKPTVYMPKVSIYIVKYTTEPMLPNIQPGSKDYYKVKLQPKSIRVKMCFML